MKSPQKKPVLAIDKTQISEVLEIGKKEMGLFDGNIRRGQLNRRIHKRSRPFKKQRQQLNEVDMTQSSKSITNTHGTAKSLSPVSSEFCISTQKVNSTFTNSFIRYESDSRKKPYFVKAETALRSNFSVRYCFISLKGLVF